MHRPYRKEMSRSMSGQMRLSNKRNCNKWFIGQLERLLRCWHSRLTFTRVKINVRSNKVKFQEKKRNVLQNMPILSRFLSWFHKFHLRWRTAIRKAEHCVYKSNRHQLRLFYHCRDKNKDNDLKLCTPVVVVLFWNTCSVLINSKFLISMHSSFSNQCFEFGTRIKKCEKN